MILGLYLSTRRISLDGALVAVRLDESFAPIAAEYWGGGAFPEHAQEACDAPLAKVFAPDTWAVAKADSGVGQVLADPSRPTLKITPSQALLLAHAGREGFALALDSPTPKPASSS